MFKWFEMGLVLAVFCVGGTACMGDMVQEASDTESTDDPLVANTATLWPNRKSIPICFKTGDGTSTIERQARELIESQYAKAGICFSGWGRCTSATPCPAIRMEIGPDRTNSGAAGWSYVGQTDWMCGSDPQGTTLWVHTNQVDWATVHEIGHAIGALHEHARTDHDHACYASKDEQEGEGGDIDYVTPYDRESVMSYCSGRSRLSALDIEGLKKLYRVGTDLSCGVTPPPPPPPPPGDDYTLSWSYRGRIPGQVCTQITEPADPHTWKDNYLCSTKDIGLRWSYRGPIAGMTCTLVNEPSDPDGWNDNYLCAPKNRGFRYSYRGPIAGMTCTKLSEGADPHTWHDNYLCRPK